MNYKVYISYKMGSQEKQANKTCDDFDLKIVEKNNRLTVSLTPKVCPIEILECRVEKGYNFRATDRFFANGYQSWTDCQEYGITDKMADLNVAGKTVMSIFGLKYVGDYTIVDYPNKTGKFHSFSYAYVHREDYYDFFGSMSDRLGHTIIYVDMNKDVLGFARDLVGKKIDRETNIIDLFFAKGSYDEVHDSYFSNIDIKPRTTDKIKGYTSWYNYYSNINQDIILNDLKSMEKENDRINTFQVDDGYQTAVGDWLSVDKKKFPNGMKYIADEIHKAGFEAGIWLAPFGAQRNSKLAKEHPDWLVRDENEKPIMCGGNWGGFYPLDIYNSEAREYIKQFFDVILNDWGFDLVKLDFLYAASIIPMHGKTRGEIAYDAANLLRECVNEKKILACGAIMMPYFGISEYMRIGADMALSWKHDIKRKLMHREDVSTPNAIVNTIYRRGLDKRAFLCDPDVFLLRKNNIHFTKEQQYVLSKFISIFGSVLFTSDDISSYDEQQLDLFREILNDQVELISIEENNRVVTLEYMDNKIKKLLEFNVDSGVIIKK